MRFSSNIFSQEQYLFWWNTTSRYYLFFKNSKMPTQPQRMFPAPETQACSHVLPHGPRPRSRPEQALHNALGEAQLRPPPSVAAQRASQGLRPAQRAWTGAPASFSMPWRTAGLPASAPKPQTTGPCPACHLSFVGRAEGRREQVHGPEADPHVTSWVSQVRRES